MDDAVKHLAKLLRSGAITPQTYAEGLSALQGDLGAFHPDPMPATAHPGPVRRAVTRHGWDGRLHRGDPFTNARRAAHPGPASAGVPPDSLGHRHSYEAGRWMCLKGTPIVQTPGLS